MSEEEKKVIEDIKMSLEVFKVSKITEKDNILLKAKDVKIILNLIEKQQEQLQEKDKIIEMMTEDIQSWRFDNSTTGKVATIEEIIEYFTKKAREV